MPRHARTLRGDEDGESAAVYQPHAALSITFWDVLEVPRQGLEGRSFAHVPDSMFGIQFLMSKNSAAFQEPEGAEKLLQGGEKRAQWAKRVYTNRTRPLACRPFPIHSRLQCGRCMR